VTDVPRDVPRDVTRDAQRCPACGQLRAAEALAETFELGMLAGLLALGLDRPTADRVGDRMRALVASPAVGSSVDADGSL
jgi:hypothetical protein